MGIDRGHRLPFRGLTTGNWLNLSLAGLLALFLFYFVLELVLGRLCSQIGVDYCDYWSAGKVATTHGYAAVYDLEILDQIQESILPAHADPASIGVVPFPYLPIFVLPFQLLALLPLESGFIIWTLFSVAAFCLYLRFFVQRLGAGTLTAQRTLLFLASLPAFQNFLTGQASVWLVLITGQFILAMADRRPMRAGLWLAGFILKPQLLMLIIPIFILQRSWRVLGGLGIGALLTGLTSLALVGPAGVLQVLALWQDYAAGRASNWIEGMMNFRMLGLQLSLIIQPGLAWSLAAAGMLAVLGLSLYRWRRAPDARAIPIAASVLGILAATVTVAWHSHIHTAMVLLPPMLLLSMARVLPSKQVVCWVFAPSVLYLLAVFVPPALHRLNLISNPGAPLVYLPFAAAQLVTTLRLFWWSLRLPSRPHLIDDSKAAPVS